jgi:hypothetical protein
MPPDYSFCIFKLFVHVILRCTALDYSVLHLRTLLVCPYSAYDLITPFVYSSFSCMSFFGVRLLITPFASSIYYCMPFSVYGP